ncbi:protein turtle homolog B-like isoform X2 [Danaus plexippus]|uniref:protein turtle homolog B-like isoform X2 n=1 Tax=Danaus plexippus TaxID=13037 RepID=UPI002AB05934|nr:protein turtle homolog B-like isoform X2 [Danaus plexippus]
MWQQETKVKNWIMKLVIKNIILIVISAVIVSGTGEWSEDAEDLVSTVEVDAVLGRTASLPCDLTPDTNEDRVYMVLWFRKSGGKPIYSFDVRGRSFNKALQWSDPGAFGPRAYFVTVARPAALTLSSVQLDDEGTYRCRVDFKNSPTRNFQIRLIVIVPPHQMLLYDKSGGDISGVFGPVEEGSALVLICEVRGGKPEPVVSWLIDGTPATQYIGEKTDTHVVVNRLELQHVRRGDLNKTFKCRAGNTHLVPPQEKAVRLEMNYSPLVSLTLGSTLNPHDIKEGDDVYFECNVKANPREHRITWYHNDRQVTQNMTSGIILSTRSLVLQRVTRREAGQYSCRAANARGETSSETVLLRVQYAPVCGMSSPRVVGAALDESLQVRCSVNADPADVVFLWQFNNSGESFNVSPARYGTLNGSTSELRYTPASERDYGALTCRGTNSVGQQAQPCVFQIVPAARPSPPRNCTVSTGNNSNWIEDSIEEAIDYLVVKCVAGYDGGLPQLVVLEALDSHSGVLRLNITANETNGVVVFLVPLEVLWSGGKALRLTVHSKNDKGASDRIVIQALSYQDPERRTDGSQSLMSGMSSTAFWTIILTILFCTSCALVTILFIRKKRARATSKQQTQELQLNSDGRQYVVAYTLKPPKQAQPDILNPQPDGNSLDCGVDAVKNGTFHTSESDSREQASISDKMSTSSSTMANKLVTISTSTLSRREHLIAEEIPGPESCV